MGTLAMKQCLVLIFPQFTLTDSVWSISSNTPIQSSRNDQNIFLSYEFGLLMDEKEEEKKGKEKEKQSEVKNSRAEKQTEGWIKSMFFILALSFLPPLSFSFCFSLFH